MSKKSWFTNRRLQTIDYNNDVNLDDLETIDFNNDIQMTDLTDIHKTDLKNTSATQQAAQKIKKHRDLKRKGETVNYSGLNKKSKSRNNNVMFIKQIPMHPRDRL